MIVVISRAAAVGTRGVRRVRTMTAIADRGFGSGGRKFGGRFRVGYLFGTHPVHVSAKGLVFPRAAVNKSHVGRHLFSTTMYLLISSRAVNQPRNNEIDIWAMRNAGSR